MIIGMKKLANDRRTTLVHDYVVGHEYEVIVAAVGDDGVGEAPEHAVRNTIVIQGRIDAPVAPTSLTAAGRIESVRLGWVCPANKDFRYVRVYESTTDDFTAATHVATVDGAPSEQIYYVWNIGGASLTRYYWITAVNSSGMESSRYPAAAGVVGTTLGVGASSIDNFSITATKMHQNVVVLDGDIWADNSPGAGSVAWNLHALYYGGARYLITASSTDKKYAYWSVGETAYQKTDTHPSAFLDENTYFIISTNESGIHDLAWNKLANAVIGNAWIDTVTVSKLTAGTITSQTITLAVAAGTGDTYIAAGKTDFTNVDSGFILGLDDSDSDLAKFYIGNTTAYMNWDGADLTVRGGLISESTLIDLAIGTEISIQGWQSDLLFYPHDYNTTLWFGGDIRLLDGTVFNISPGSTGNMAALTYIYLDIAISLMALQVTTTPATAVGPGKLLVAVASNNTDATSKATYQVFGGSGGTLVDVDHIAANSTSTNEFVSNTAQIKNAIITSAKIYTLTANKLTAGTIDASVITVSNLNATNLTVGTLPVARIGAASIEDTKIGTTVISGGKIITGLLTATNIQTGTLSADRIGATTITAAKLATDVIDSGKIITGLLTATNIQTGTLTGRTVQTAASGQRAVMDISDNTIKIIDASNNELIILDDNIYASKPGIKLQGASTSGVITIVKDANNWMRIEHEAATNCFEIISGGSTSFIITGYGALLAWSIIDTKAGFKYNGTQVVGAQGAAVADATGAGDVVAQLNALLARCRAHGLIAT